MTKEEKELVYKKVTQHLLFNIYAITSDIDVFIAFETMNNRGKPLSNLELLKNRLIYLSTKFKIENSEKEKLRRIINDGWRGIYHYLGLNKDKPLNDDVFLNNHCLIYFGQEIFAAEEIQENRIRRRSFFGFVNGFDDFLLESKFTVKNVLIDSKLTEKSIKEYVESLQKAVGIWYNLYNPTSENSLVDEERFFLDRLNKIGMQNTSTLLLAVYLKRAKVELRIKILKAIENLIFIQSLTDGHFGYNNEYTSLAIQVHKGETSPADLLKSIEERIKTMKERSDFIERAIENFKSDGFYSWQNIRYFLYEYEMSIKKQTKTSKRKIDWSEFDNEKEDFITVEHIYPQSAKSECWKVLFNEYSLKERKILNNSLGNLLPLSKPKNSSLQNRCFQDKIENKESYVGFKYGSYSENEISRLPDWTPVRILERGLKLVKFMEQRWLIDFGSEEKRIEFLNLHFVKRTSN